VLVVGGLLGAASSLWCVVAVGDEPALRSLLPALLLFGWSIGMVGITSAAAALAGLDAEALAMANSAFQTSRRIVQTLGLAAVVAILGDRSADSLALFQRVWWVSVGGFLFSVVVALWYPVVRRGDAPASPVAPGQAPAAGATLEPTDPPVARPAALTRREQAPGTP
jgi:hypothetical protein